MSEYMRLKQHEELSTENYLLLVSDSGDIFSKKYNKTSKKWTLKNLKTYIDQGYEKVKVQGKYKMVSRLVAETWLDLPPDYFRRKYEVHHINGDRLDNRAENLFFIKKRYHKTIHAVKNIKKLTSIGKIQVRENIVDIFDKEIEKLAEDIQGVERDRFDFQKAFYASNQFPREIETKTNKIYVNISGVIYELEV